MMGALGLPELERTPAYQLKADKLHSVDTGNNDMTEGAVLGEIGDSFAENSANMLSRIGPYRITRSDGKIKFSLRWKYSKSAKLLTSSEWFSSTNIGQFNLSSFPASPGLPEIDRTCLTDDQINRIEQLLTDREGFHRFHMMSKIIMWASLSQLQPIIRGKLAPLFFTWYPKGRFIFVMGSPEFNMALAALRMMGAARDLDAFNYSRSTDVPAFSMLSSLQNVGLFYPGKHLSIPIAMFLPRLYGFAASKVALSFLFVLDEPIEESRGYFPRSGLEFVRSEASNLMKESVDIDLSDLSGLSVEQLDTFSIFPKKFSHSEFRNFMMQYLSKFNSYLSFVLNPTNFTDDETNVWIGLSHYRAWLSVERIADEVLHMLTDVSPFLRKMAFFRVIDQLSCLISEEYRLQSTLFKQLLLPGEASDIISEGLTRYKGSIAKYLKVRLKEARADLKRVCIESIYIQDHVDYKGGKVQLGDDSCVDFDEYVTCMVREVRNTHHGYYTKRFDRYLSISTGNTPDSLPVIGILAYLSLIAAPELFIRRSWDLSNP
jgi:hypothetical protein